MPPAGMLRCVDSIAQRNGYTQTLTYSTTGSQQQLASVSDSYSRSLTFTYNSNGTLASVSTPDSTTITYGYTSGSEGAVLTSVSYPTSPASGVTYAYGNSTVPTALTGIADENGNTYATWTYDAYGRGLTSAFGGSSLNANLTTLAYDDSNGTRTVQTGFCNPPQGNCVTDTYTFTTLQNVPKVTQISRAATNTTAAATKTFTYSGDGYVATATNWNDGVHPYNSISYGYPTPPAIDYGLPITINEAVGTSVARTTTITYDTGSQNSPPLPHSPLTIVTAGLTNGFPGDSPQTITYAYDNGGEVLTKTVADTTPTNQQPYSTNGQTRKWTNTWNNSLLASVKTPNGNLTQYGYSSTGALTSITDALNHVTNITNSGGGFPETIIDPNGATNGTTTTQTYDNRQRLTSKAVATVSNGTETTTYTLDAVGNLTKLTLPDNSYISYIYDTAHRLTQATNVLGEYQKYTLDALGDRTQVNNYDSSNNLWRQQSRTFDALGRELKYVGGNGLDTTSYTYDPNGNTLTVTDGNNHATTRVFDALNRLNTSTDANTPTQGVTTIAYDAHDRPLTVSDPNSNVTSYVYDGFGDAIQQTGPDSGSTIYHYDGDANLTSKTDALNVTTNYTYDALDRITSRSGAQWAFVGYDSSTVYPQNSGVIGHLSWANDPAGYLYFAHD
jgi:YD repeat-containing protein